MICGVLVKMVKSCRGKYSIIILVLINAYPSEIHFATACDTLLKNILFSQIKYCNCEATSKIKD